MTAVIKGLIKKSKAKKVSSAKVVDNSAVKKAKKMFKQIPVVQDLIAEARGAKKKYVVTSTLYPTRKLAEEHLDSINEVSHAKKKLMVVEVSRIIVTKNPKAKEYFLVNSKGMIASAPYTGLFAVQRMRFGNAFETREEAEEARKRIVKVFERMKK